MIDLRSLEDFDLPLTAAALLAVQRALFQTQKIMQPTILVTPSQKNTLLADIEDRCQFVPQDRENVHWNGIHIHTEPATLTV